MSTFTEDSGHTNVNILTSLMSPEQKPSGDDGADEEEGITNKIQPMTIQNQVLQFYGFFFSTVRSSNFFFFFYTNTFFDRFTHVKECRIMKTLPVT